MTLNSLAERALVIPMVGGMAAAYTVALLGLLGVLDAARVLPVILLGAALSFATGVAYFALVERRVARPQ